MIKNYNFENNKDNTPFIGQRLFTPQNNLDESLNYIPSYNSKGLKNEVTIAKKKNIILKLLEVEDWLKKIPLTGLMIKKSINI